VNERRIHPLVEVCERAAPKKAAQVVAKRDRDTRLALFVCAIALSLPACIQIAIVLMSNPAKVESPHEGDHSVKSESEFNIIERELSHRFDIMMEEILTLIAADAFIRRAHKRGESQ
jgi:hypothetical protein